MRPNPVRRSLAPLVAAALLAAAACLHGQAAPAGQVRWAALLRTADGAVTVCGPSVGRVAGCALRFEVEAGPGASWMILRQADGGPLELFTAPADGWHLSGPARAETFWLVMWPSGSPPAVVGALLRGDPQVRDPARIRDIMLELRRIQLSQAPFSAEPFAPVRFAGAWRAPPGATDWGVYSGGPAGVARYDLE